MAEDLFTVKQATKYLNVSRASLYVLTSTGRLPWTEIAGLRGRRFRRADLDALKKRQEGKKN